MKFKKESGGLYCCSTYDNYGKSHCDRVIVKEEFLKSLVCRRFEKELSDEEIREVIDHILVEDYLLLEIYFKNNEKPILLQGKFIQF